MRTEEQIQADLTREVSSLVALRKRLRGYIAELRRMPGERQWMREFRRWDRPEVKAGGAEEPEMTRAASLVGGLDDAVRDIGYLVESLRLEARDRSTPLLLPVPSACSEAEGGAR
jgi:hypothetical protein